MELQGQWREATTRLAAGLDAVFGALAERAGRAGGDLARRPAGGAWSGAEVLEHVALTNHFLLILVDKIAARCRARVARGEVWPAHPPAFEILRGLASRETSWDAPAHMLPTGAVAPAEAARRLADQGRRCAALLEELAFGEGTLHRIRMSMVGGEDDRLDLYQFLELLRLHAERHVAQVDRVSG